VSDVSSSRRRRAATAGARFRRIVGLAQRSLARIAVLCCSPLQRCPSPSARSTAARATRSASAATLTGCDRPPAFVVLGEHTLDTVHDHPRTSSHASSRKRSPGPARLQALLRLLGERRLAFGGRSIAIRPTPVVQGAQLRPRPLDPAGQRRCIPTTLLTPPSAARPRNGFVDAAGQRVVSIRALSQRTLPAHVAAPSPAAGLNLLRAPAGRLAPESLRVRSTRGRATPRAQTPSGLLPASGVTGARVAQPLLPALERPQWERASRLHIQRRSSSPA